VSIINTNQEEDILILMSRQGDVRRKVSNTFLPLYISLYMYYFFSQ